MCEIHIHDTRHLQMEIKNKTCIYQQIIPGNLSPSFPMWDHTLGNRTMNW